MSREMEIRLFALRVATSSREGCHYRVKNVQKIKKKDIGVVVWVVDLEGIDAGGRTSRAHVFIYRKAGTLYVYPGGY